MDGVTRRCRRGHVLLVAALVAVITVTAGISAPGAGAEPLGFTAHCVPIPAGIGGAYDRPSHVSAIAPPVVQPGQKFSLIVSIDYPISLSANIAVARIAVTGADPVTPISAGQAAIAGTSGASGLWGVADFIATGPVGGTITLALVNFAQGVIVSGHAAGESCTPPEPVTLTTVGIGSPIGSTDPTVSVGDGAIAEGSATAAHILRIPVTLSSPATTTVSVDATVSDGTAIGSRSGVAGPDFVARRSATHTVNFVPDPITGLTPTVAYVKVPVIGDAADEGDEHLRVTLTNPKGGYPILDAVGTGTILDDDHNVVGPVVEVGAMRVREGKAGVRSLKVPVSLSEPLDQAVTAVVDIHSGTAICPLFVGAVPVDADCRGRAGIPVTFAPGQTDATVAVRVYPDVSSELDEFAVVSATGILPGPIPVGLWNAEGLITLGNDD